MVKRVAPLSFEAWVDYELRGAELSHAELEALRRLVRVTEDGGLAPRVGAGPLGVAELEALGLSRRELEELRAKLAAAPAAASFVLDVASARPPEHFARVMEEAVPRVDRR